MTSRRLFISGSKSPNYLLSSVGWATPLTWKTARGWSSNIGKVWRGPGGKFYFSCPPQGFSFLLPSSGPTPPTAKAPGPSLCYSVHPHSAASEQGFLWAHSWACLCCHRAPSKRKQASGACTRSASQPSSSSLQTHPYPGHLAPQLLGLRFIEASASQASKLGSTTDDSTPPVKTLSRHPEAGKPREPAATTRLTIKGHGLEWKQLSPASSEEGCSLSKLWQIHPSSRIHQSRLRPAREPQGFTL